MNKLAKILIVLMMLFVSTISVSAEELLIIDEDAIINIVEDSEIKIRDYRDITLGAGANKIDINSAKFYKLNENEDNYLEIYPYINYNYFTLDEGTYKISANVLDNNEFKVYEKIVKVVREGLYIDFYAWGYFNDDNYEPQYQTLGSCNIGSQNQFVAYYVNSDGSTKVVKASELESEQQGIIFKDVYYSDYTCISAVFNEPGVYNLKLKNSDEYFDSVALEASLPEYFLYQEKNAEFSDENPIDYSKVLDSLNMEIGESVEVSAFKIVNNEYINITNDLVLEQTDDYVSITDGVITAFQRVGIGECKLVYKTNEDFEREFRIYVHEYKYTNDKNGEVFLTIDGKKCSIGLSDLHDNSIHLVSGHTSSGIGPMGYQICLSIAEVDSLNRVISALPNEYHKKISNVRATIVDEQKEGQLSILNADENGNISEIVHNENLNSDVYVLRVIQNEGIYGFGTIRVDFDYENERYSLYHYFGLSAGNNISITLPEGTTADEINNILSSRQNFKSFITQETGVTPNKETSVELILPKGDIDSNIIVDIGMDSDHIDGFAIKGQDTYGCIKSESYPLVVDSFDNDAVVYSLPSSFDFSSFSELKDDPDLDRLCLYFYSGNQIRFAVNLSNFSMEDEIIHFDGFDLKFDKNNKKIFLNYTVTDGYRYPTFGKIYIKAEMSNFVLDKYYEVTNNSKSDSLEVKLNNYDKDELYRALSDPTSTSLRITMYSDSSQYMYLEQDNEIKYYSSENFKIDFDKDSGILVLSSEDTKNYPTIMSANIAVNKSYEILNRHETTINGGIIIKSGIVGFENIGFRASDENKYKAKDGNDYKLGIYICADHNEYGSQKVGTTVSQLSNCGFEGYDYAVWADGDGLFTGVNNTLFKNCVNAYTISTEMYNYYSNSSNITFVDCVNCITINKNNGFISPFQFKMNNMSFYGTKGFDYIIEDGGAYIFTKNYYGKSLDGRKTNENVRSAKVSYGSSNIKALATNPCVMYPESNVALGIDPSEGLITKILNGSKLKINTSNLKNSESPLNINICDPNNGEQIAGLKLGGTNNE